MVTIKSMYSQAWTSPSKICVELSCKVWVVIWLLFKPVDCPLVYISSVDLENFRSQVNFTAASTHFSAQVGSRNVTNDNNEHFQIDGITLITRWLTVHFVCYHNYNWEDLLFVSLSRTRVNTNWCINTNMMVWTLPSFCAAFSQAFTVNWLWPFAAGKNHNAFKANWNPSVCNVLIFPPSFSHPRITCSHNASAVVYGDSRKSDILIHNPCSSSRTYHSHSYIYIRLLTGWTHTGIVYFILLLLIN